MTQPRIICAACRTTDGRIVCGPRHFDGTMWSQIVGVTLEAFTIMQRDGTLPPLPDAVKPWQGAEQGFIDQHGKFYTREEAWPIALMNNQILQYELDSKWSTGKLYSEHLY